MLGEAAEEDGGDIPFTLARPLLLLGVCREALRLISVVVVVGEFLR